MSYAVCFLHNFGEKKLIKYLKNSNETVLLKSKAFTSWVDFFLFLRRFCNFKRIKDNKLHYTLAVVCIQKRNFFLCALQFYQKVSNFQNELLFI